MAVAAQDHAASASLRCSHCGRAVRGTTHTREAWKVDYYLLHTGDVEPASIVRDPERGEISYLKLVSRIDIVTCSDCYRDPRVRRERDESFRAELYGGGAG